MHSSDHKRVLFTVRQATTTGKIPDNTKDNVKEELFNFKSFYLKYHRKLKYQSKTNTALA